MKIKLFFIQLFVFVCIQNTFSQELGVYSNNNYSGEIISYLSSRMSKDNASGIVDLSKVKGSPYENEAFQLGKAENKLGGKPQSLYLRYNVYNDVIEIKEMFLDPEITGLITSLNIYATINNQEYHYEIFSDANGSTNEGYFILISKGSNSSLYLRKTKKFKDLVKAKDSFHKDTPAAFIDEASYYIKKGRILFPVATKKKEFLKQFPEKEKELKQFIKTEKINLKNKDDLIKIFTYYDAIL